MPFHHMDKYSPKGYLAKRKICFEPPMEVFYLHVLECTYVYTRLQGKSVNILKMASMVKNTYTSCTTQLVS